MAVMVLLTLQMSSPGPGIFQENQCPPICPPPHAESIALTTEMHKLGAPGGHCPRRTPSWGLFQRAAPSISITEQSPSLLQNAPSAGARGTSGCEDAVCSASTSARYALGRVKENSGDETMTAQRPLRGCRGLAVPGDKCGAPRISCLYVLTTCSQVNLPS